MQNSKCKGQNPEAVRQKPVEVYLLTFSLPASSFCPLHFHNLLKGFYAKQAE
jgi:hypothetical protein